MFDARTSRLRWWRHGEPGVDHSWGTCATAVVDRPVDGRMAKLLSVAIARWLHLFQASREDWAAVVILETLEAPMPLDCPCSRSGPGVWCSFDYICQYASFAAWPNSPLGKRFIASYVSLLACFASLSGLGMAAPGGASTRSSHDQLRRRFLSTAFDRGLN